MRDRREAPVAVWKWVVGIAFILFAMVWAIYREGHIWHWWGNK